MHAKKNTQKVIVKRHFFADIHGVPEDAKTILPELERLDFIKDGRNVVLFGNPGTGKTHMSIGIGIKACQQGYKVLVTAMIDRQTHKDFIVNMSGSLFNCYIQ